MHIYFYGYYHDFIYSIITSCDLHFLASNNCQDQLSPSSSISHHPRHRFSFVIHYNHHRPLFFNHQQQLSSLSIVIIVNSIHLCWYPKIHVNNCVNRFLRLLWNIISCILKTDWRVVGREHHPWIIYLCLHGIRFDSHVVSSSLY